MLHNPTKLSSISQSFGMETHVIPLLWISSMKIIASASFCKEIMAGRNVVQKFVHSDIR